MQRIGGKFRYTDNHRAGVHPVDQLSGMNDRFKTWLKRMGWLGFLFFLIKGLLWLLIPYLIAKGILSR